MFVHSSWLVKYQVENVIVHLKQLTGQFINLHYDCIRYLLRFFQCVFRMLFLNNWNERANTPHFGGIVHSFHCASWVHNFVVSSQRLTNSIGTLVDTSFVFHAWALVADRRCRLFTYLYLVPVFDEAAASTLHFTLLFFFREIIWLLFFVDQFKLLCKLWAQKWIQIGKFDLIRH